MTTLKIALIALGATIVIGSFAVRDPIGQRLAGAGAILAVSASFM